MKKSPKEDPEKKEIKKFLAKIGKRMTAIRKAKGYKNYEKFAYENNISRAQYGRYERGEDFNMSSFKKVLDGFKMTPKEFFSEGFD